MSEHCKDCGTRLWNYVCPNCHEELCIIENQGEFIDFALSDMFLEKADEQKGKVDKIRKREVEVKYGKG